MAWQAPAFRDLPRLCRRSNKLLGWYSQPLISRRYSFANGIRINERHSRELFKTWLLQNPSQANYEEIVSLLPQLQSPERDEIIHACMLATPAFAHWFGDSHPFLKQAISHIWGRSVVGKTVTFTFAIVDSLPDPRPSTHPRPSFEGLGLPHSDRGHEGLSLKLHSSGRDVTCQLASNSDAEDGLAVIRFNTPAGQDRNFRGDVRPVSRSIALPTANTLFTNGQSSTLFQDIWVRVADASGTRKFMRKEHRRLKTFDVFLIREPFSLLDLYLPLVQVTGIRYITSSMGNIIREIQNSPFVEPSRRDDRTKRGTERPFPASQEIENVVPQILASRQARGTHTPLQVYALVVPAEVGSHYLTKSTEFPGLRDALWDGARLHRVTSGGGGWGNKKGLLSLEPAVNFDPTPTNSDFSSLFPDAGGGPKSPQSNLVAPGNFVSFYVTRERDGMADVFSPRKFAKKSNVAESAFGVIPESEDPGTAANETLEQPCKCYAFSNYFGMLSERGACIELWEGEMPTRSALVRAMKRVAQSRLDVPYMLFKTLSYGKTIGLVGSTNRK